MKAVMLEIGQGKRKQVLEAKSILYIKADINYSRFILNDGTFAISSKNVGSYEKLLPSFVRTHKSYLLNPAYFKELQQENKATGEIALLNGEIIPSSRRRGQAVRALLSI